MITINQNIEKNTFTDFLLSFQKLILSFIKNKYKPEKIPICNNIILNGVYEIDETRAIDVTILNENSLNLS